MPERARVAVTLMLNSDRTARKMLIVISFEIHHYSTFVVWVIRSDISLHIIHSILLTKHLVYPTMINSLKSFQGYYIRWTIDKLCSLFLFYFSFPSLHSWKQILRSVSLCGQWFMWSIAAHLSILESYTEVKPLIIYQSLFPVTSRTSDPVSPSGTASKGSKNAASTEMGNAFGTCSLFVYSELWRFTLNGNWCSCEKKLHSICVFLCVALPTDSTSVVCYGTTWPRISCGYWYCPGVGASWRKPWFAESLSLSVKLKRWIALRTFPRATYSSSCLYFSLVKMRVLVENHLSLNYCLIIIVSHAFNVFVYMLGNVSLIIKLQLQTSILMYASKIYSVSIEMT